MKLADDQGCARDRPTHSDKTRLENINLAMIWGGPVINREAVIFYDTSCKMWGIP